MRNMRMLWAPVIALAAGCGDDGGGAESEAEGEVDLSDIPAWCNPLSDDDCLVPFPATVYLAADDSTRTGWRVDLPSEALPANTEGVVLDPTRMNTLDGFSSATYFIAWWAGGVDGSSLPPLGDPAQSLGAASPTAIVNMTTGQRVPHFAELDANVETDEDRQGLILRPVVRLDPGTRYAIGVSRAIGASPSRGFQSLLDGTTSSHAALERIRPDYDAIFPALEKAGMARDDLAVAWDMRTASDETYVGAMNTMVGAGLGAVPAMDYTIDDKIEDPDDPNLLRIVEGTYQVPNFLGEDGYVSDPPAADGTYSSEFTVLIPRAAETDGPLPVLLFGHGLFGSGRDYLAGGIGDLLGPAALANENGYVFVATDWIGLHDGDEPEVIAGLTNANNLHVTTEKLRQAVVNTIALGRLTQERFRGDPDFSAGGGEAISDAGLVYWGISLGGIMGLTTLAYDPDLGRGALGVPGGNWGMMIQRSSNWPDFRAVMRQWYPDYLDELKLLLLAQALFDFSDPITTAARVLTDAPSGGPKQALMLEARCDSQVPNIATETVARTMSIPLLSPTIEPVFGLDEMGAPLPSALVRYDLDPSVCPDDSNAPVREDNYVHLFVNVLDEALEQVITFLRDGEVVDTCGGPCECSLLGCM